MNPRIPRRTSNTWVPENEYNPQWVHARNVVGGCGGMPRTANLDRVTCPACLTPPARTEITEVDDDE